MNDRKALTRIVWYLNHGEPGVWRGLAERAGYSVDSEERGRYVEHRMSRDGRGLALIHHWPGDEAFLFLWEPEAKCPWWRVLLWRLRHPATGRTEAPRTA